MSGEYYDIDGNVITQDEWAQGWGGEDRFLAKTDFQCATGTATASTVHLGINHNYYDGAPLIFETMIFCSCDDEFMWRYATKEQALTGHWGAVDSHSIQKHYFLEEQWEQL